MKKTITIFLILFILIISFLWPQEDEVTTTETVSVVNVEVPVRVFLKDKPVDNLSKNDFKLYENGELQTIHGFYKVTKTIKNPNSETIVKQKSQIFRPRYFTLVFRLIKYNKELEKGLSYIFEEILRKDDQLLVFANNRSLFLNKITNKKNSCTLVQDLLKDECHKARLRLDTYLRKIETELNMARLNSLLQKESEYTVTDDVIKFLKKYLVIWNEYKRNYLMPNMDRFYYFAHHLEKIQKEKWVINFYQIELFPKLKISGTIMREIRNLTGFLQGSHRSEDRVFAKTISTLLMDINETLNTSLDFPAKEISKLFYKVNATFHSILININRELLSQDFEFKRISTNIENSLREITKKTGGSLIASGNLKYALNKIQEKEDILYMLTYSPKNPKKIGKIRIVLNKKNHRIIYDDQMRADYIKNYLKNKKMEIPEIKIDKLHFKSNSLSLVISNFLLKKNNNGNHGNINVQIRILDNHNRELYNKNKNIVTKKNTFSISVKFPWLTKGRYDILLHVTDINTGKSALDYIQSTI